MPYGIKTADSTFIRAIKHIGNRFDEVLTVYIDDYFISTRRSINEHLSTTDPIFSVLQKKEFYIKFRQVIFLQKTSKISRI